ncbi:hypothetical protein ACQRD4_05245, partial [Streptococcus hyointestinalis]
ILFSLLEKRDGTNRETLNVATFLFTLSIPFKTTARKIPILLVSSSLTLVIQFVTMTLKKDLL